MIPPLRLREDEDKGQVPGCLLRPPEAGAGEGVPLQQVHHHQEEGGARPGAQPHREAGERRPELGRDL